MAVNVARLGQAVAGAPRGGRWIRHLEQMSDTAVWMLERAADHAVDIAEQVWFLVTGELMEFDNAPRVPAPAS
jgi:ABC-type branched-subunit amino acid transport system ATPase component